MPEFSDSQLKFLKDMCQTIMLNKDAMEAFEVDHAMMLDLTNKLAYILIQKNKQK
jgi:hypothetical protein